MPIRIITMIAAIFLAAVAPAAHAAEILVTQSGKQFSKPKASIKAGDTIRFVNDDITVHNVHSVSRGHKFDLGAQDPGTEMTKKFNDPGKIKIRCAIHPKMKMSIIVE